ncbi:MAG: nuclear transport factor 2 family protein [Cyclobacteriaceae bacterium]
MMKNLMVVLCTTLVYVSCQQPIDIESEKESIKAVIESSGQAWLDRDYEAMKAIWLQSDMTSRLAAGNGGYGFTQSWDDQMTRYQNLFEQYPEASGYKELFDNYRISVYPECAWALVDHAVVNPEGDTLNYGLFTYILEKQDGRWKLAALSTIATSGYDNMQLNLAASETYHKLNPDKVDHLLTDDFSGHDEIGGSWDRGSHKDFLTSNKGNMSDSIIFQMANGNIVATTFKRKGKLNGKDVNGEAMQYKRFQNGKIAEIWEYGFGVFKQ